MSASRTLITRLIAALTPKQLGILAWLSNISNFSTLVIEKPLRSYQLEPANAILDSILNQRGFTFAVMMSRQAGKNELSGQLEAYLLIIQTLLKFTKKLDNQYLFLEAWEQQVIYL